MLQEAEAADEFPPPYKSPKSEDGSHGAATEVTTVCKSGELPSVCELQNSKEIQETAAATESTLKSELNKPPVSAPFRDIEETRETETSILTDSEMEILVKLAALARLQELADELEKLQTEVQTVDAKSDEEMEDKIGTCVVALCCVGLGVGFIFIPMKAFLIIGWILIGLCGCAVFGFCLELCGCDLD